MTTDEHKQAAELFHKISELPFSEQSAALAEACGGNEEIRQEVLGLLAADREAAGGEFLNRTAIEIAAEQIHLGPGSEGPPKPGTILGKYQLGQQIGAGGMGVVFEAQDLQLMRRVALKVLTKAADEQSEERTQRFLREARVAAQLSHPNIASIYDAGVEHGIHFIAMEMVEGRTLRSLINAESGRLEAPRILELIGQTAAALTAAHAAGIVHRDIKPENIMIRPDGFVKVLDFGLAAVKEPVSSQGHDLRTRPGHVAGTLQYFAPEQVLGHPAEARSDLFSLGVVAYELAVGVRPFDGKTDGAIFEAILHHQPPPPSAVRPALGNQLDELVMRLLDKDPDLRFQTAADLRSTCRRRTISSSDVVSVSPSAGISKPPAKRSLHRWMVACAVLAVIGVCIALLTLPQAPRVLGISQITRDGLTKEYFVSDGLRLYYAIGETDSTSRFFQVSIRGGEPVAMPWLNGMIPFDITKDGSVMLLGQQAGGLADGRLLWLANTVGGAPRKFGVYTAFDARFSPNDKEILYTSSEGVMIAPVDGGNPRLLAKLPGFIRNLAWSPDGRLIRFTLGDDAAPAIWEMRGDGSNPHELFAKTSSEAQTAAATLPVSVEHGNWTRDGKFFVFSAKAPQQDLWVTPSRSRWLPEWKIFGPPLTRLTNGPLIADIPVPNPDGKRIFFRGRLDKGELVRYQPATNEWRPYLNGLPATQVDYSRDGKWITYVGHRDHCVWRCASDGTNCSQLTSPPVFAVVPFFSPDGSRIIFFDSPTGEGSKSHVYLVPAAGGAVRQLTHGEAGPDGDDGGSWGPDGESLVFSAHGGDHAPNRSDALLPLRVLNVNSGDMKILPGSEGLWSVRWSPDGRYIAAMNSSQTLLFLYDPVTHTKRQITDIAASWPQWSRDSKSIYFGHNGFWYRVSISDRKLERLAPLDKLKMADWTLGWVGVTPDGDLIATADAGSTEIYALDWERR